MLSDHAEDDTMRQGKKIHTAAIGMLCLATLTTGACVTRSTYDTAAADLEAAKAELHSTNAQTQELTQQVGDLQQRKSDLSKKMVVASLALDRATKEMKGERAASQKRLSNLSRTIKQLTSQQKSLRDGFKRATKEQARLQSVVDSQTPILAEANGLSASSVPPAEPAKTALVTPEQTPVPNESAPKPTLTATAAPVNQPATNAKPQSAVNQPPEPVEEDWLSFLKNWIASLWQSVIF
jgi:cell division protein FtsB